MSVEPSIRRADPTDAQAIARVQVAGWRAAYVGLMPEALLAGLSVEQRAAGWRTRLSRAEPASYRCFVLVGPDVLGFVSTGPSRDEDLGADALEIYAFYLDPRVWGRGLAGRSSRRPWTICARVVTAR